MPTINRKLLLRLFIATLVFGVGLFLIHYVQEDRATDAMRWQAERAAENGRLDKAIFYMRQYLELRPSDHEAAVKLGDLILTRGSGRKELASVLFLYERVLREAPDRDELRRRLVDISLKLNRHGDATIHARALLAKSPRDGDLWEKLAICQSAQNKPDDARASYEKAIDCEPTRIRSYELLAELLIRQLNLPDEASECIEKMVRANPAAGEAYLIRARFVRSQNKIPECLKNIDKLLEIDPENADGLLILSEILQTNGDVTKARTSLTEGVALHEKDVRFYRALSYLELSSGNIATAIGCLEQGMVQLPNSTELLTPLGDLLVQQGELDKVQGIIKKLEGKKNVETQLKYLRGRVAMQTAKWSEAIAMFESLRTEAVAMPGLAAQVNLLLAGCHERLGDREAQNEALKRVLLIDQGNLNARLKFGAIHLEAGDLNEAIKEYTVAARSPFAPLGSRVTLGRLLIARARIGGTANEWLSVGEYVNALRDKYKNTVDPVLLAAEMHMARQQYSAAKKLLRAEAGKKVNDARIWSVLSAIALEAEGLHAALEVLEEAQGIIGDQSELRLARARVWTVDGQSGREERIRALGRGVEELADAEQFRLLAGLSETCATIRDWQGVKFFQKQIATRAPKDLSIRRSLYTIAVRSGDTALRTQLRAELKVLGADSVVEIADALAESTALTPTDAKFAELQSLANKTLAATPDLAGAQLLAAKLAERSGDRRTAAKHYTRAVELERGSMDYLEAKILFLMRGSDESAAKKRIEQLFQDPRLPGEAFLGLIDGLAGELPPEQAEKCIAWAEPLVKSSGVSLLWMSRIQQAKGNRNRAAELANRASTLMPKLVDAWIARVRLRPEFADETLRAARGTLDDRAWFLLCAEIQDAIRTQKPEWTPEFKKPEDRRLFAQAAMNAYALRGKMTEAADVLNKLVGDEKAQPQDVVWAKRNLALLAVSRGNGDDRRKAVVAIKDMVPDANANLDELRSRVASLALASRHLHGVERKAALQQAIDAMKRIAEDKESTAKDWYQLAQFQRLAGDRDAYREGLNEAMKRDEGNLFYVVACVDDLLMENRLEEAEPFLSRLLQASNDPRATSTAARYYVQASHPALAIEVVDKYTQSADAGTNDGLVRLRHAAEVLDQLARMAASRSLPSAKTLLTAALDKYRFTLKNYPEAVGPMAALMAFDNRIPAAFELLTSMKSSLSMKALTTAAVGVLRIGGASPVHFRQVKTWLDAALIENPTSVALKMNLAELHALRQEYAEAEPLYRDVLHAEPENIVALNNLAWMLAPRSNVSDESMKCVEKAIELSGPSGELLDTRARIFIARGDLERAIEDLNQALDQAPTSLRYFHLALAQFKQLKKVEATNSFKEARTRGLDPKMIHPSDMPTYKALSSEGN